MAFGSLFSLYDTAFKLRYISFTWIICGVLTGLVLGFICSFVLKNMPDLKDTLVLPETDSPLYHCWFIGAFGGGYASYNLHAGIGVFEESSGAYSVVIFLYSMASILCFAGFIAIDNSIKAREKIAKYLPAIENTWTPLTLMISLLTAFTLAQIGGVFCVAYCISIMLSLGYLVYAVETFGFLPVLVIGGFALAFILMLYFTAQRRRREANTLRLLEELETIPLTE